jgi:hypothetical protein
MKRIKKLFRIVKGESGVTLMVVMLFLFLMTILGMTMYFMSSTDLKISGNVYKGTQAFYNAEAGISLGISRLNLKLKDVSDPPVGWDADMFDSKPYDPNFRYPTNADSGDLDYIEANLDGSVKPYKGLDVDGDGHYDSLYYMVYKLDASNNIVTYDKENYPTCSNCPEGAASGDVGYPVIRIISTGFNSAGTDVSKRESTVTTILEISKIPLEIDVRGAISANSNVEVTGNFSVSGLDHNLDGTLVGSGDLPGVIATVGNTIDKDGSATIEGDPPFVGPTENGTWDPAVDGAFPRFPEDALGLTGELADYFLEPGNCDYYGPATVDIKQDPLSGITYVIDDYQGPFGGGEGILIVHNPNFDPCIYEASAEFEATGDTSHACYNSDWNDPASDVYWGDVGYYHENPVVQPADFELASNATFKGIIIADKIVKVSGDPTIYGALISLSTIDVNNLGVGNATVYYSSEALHDFAISGFSIKLSWNKE